MFIPHEAPWLNGYLHELMMFPKGRFDDQVDSTAQALGFIGTPDSFDAWMDYMRSEALRGYELTPEDLTVAFDFIYPDIVLDMPSGRSLCREEDGFHHCSRAEWAGLLCMPGVTIIRG